MQTADFYSSATGTLRVNGGRDENAPAGVSLSIDDLSYIKQGSRANEESGSGFTPTEAQLAAMNSGITSSDVAQITTNKNNISLNEQKTKQVTYTTVAAGTYEIVSDLAITVQPGKVLEFGAYGLGTSSRRCVAIRAMMFDDNAIIAENDTGSTFNICPSITGVFYNFTSLPVTINFSVKYSATGDNTVGITYNIYDANQ